MLKEKKKLPASRVSFTISVTAADFRHAFDHELHHITEDTVVPGFRKGKAPAAKVLAQVGRQRVEGAALDASISKAYFEALQGENIIPVAQPELQINSFIPATEGMVDDAEVATFVAEVDVMPEVKLGDYKKITLEQDDDVTVGEDKVQEVLDYLQRQHATLEPTEADVKVAEKNWVDIGYVGSVDGVKRDDMKNDHHPIVIGEGQLIPGFEDGLIGLKAGEEKTLELTFPKEYHASELSGKKAVFEVKVHEIRTVNLPEFDDEFAKRYDQPTLAKLKEEITKTLENEKQQEHKQAQEESILDQLVKLTKAELPVSLVEQELERMYQDSKERLQKLNFQWETYLQQVGKTEEELREEMRPQAERSVTIGLALAELMDAEGIDKEKSAGRVAIDRLVEIAKANKPAAKPKKK